MSAKTVDAPTLKTWLSDGGEIALIDVREYGQYGEGHPFFAVSLPYSRFDAALPALVPNAGVRLVLVDAGDGVAERAAERAAGMGYGAVYVLTGGTPAWGAAGFTLYRGVNVPSKTFGEIIEHKRHTPRITADELKRRVDAGDNIRIIDGRPFAEYTKMSIPGGVCCPNGEMAANLAAITSDPDATIVVNCAGRTRSIIGAETLRALGVKNPVLALENGTQGWFLAGLDLARGADRQLTHAGAPKVEQDVAAHVKAQAVRFGARFAGVEEVQRWLDDDTRTTYLIDVRTAEEYAADQPAGFVHAPGGQLIQATDQWVGVKGARLVLADGGDVRAAVVAGWLAQLGHDAIVLDGDVAAAAGALKRAAAVTRPRLPVLTPIGAGELGMAVEEGSFIVLDVRASMAYRKSHAAGAGWAIRPRLEAALGDTSKPVALIADEQAAAALVASDLAARGLPDIRLLSGGLAAWVAAGLPVVTTPDDPADEDCIDFLFFVHDRHEGNAEAARQYLAWETGLLAQLDEQERGVFRIVD